MVDEKPLPFAGMVVLEIDNERRWSARDFDGVEIASTSFVSGTLHVTTDETGCVQELRNNGRKI